MSLPQTIRATISPDTIDKVGRLFNGGPADIVTELLQNARRAGATQVGIEIVDVDGRPTLFVRDDGLHVAPLLGELRKTDECASRLSSHDQILPC
jgi:hypothetical protein